jgi:Subtilase family
MANPYQHPHLWIRFFGKKETYKSGQKIVPPAPPERNRETHASYLIEQFYKAIDSARAQNPDADGFYLKFVVPPGHEHIVDALESRKKRIEVVGTKPLASGETAAIVSIPRENQNFFPAKFDAYKSKNTKTGRPKNNDLISRIEQVEKASAEDLFSGEALPADHESINWEIWIRRDRFDHLHNLGLLGTDHDTLVFPERIVVPFSGTLSELEQVVQSTDAIAEIRVNTLPSVFVDVPNEIQGKLADNLLSRTTFSELGEPIICLLDTGVNRGHPLLTTAIHSDHVEAFNPAWGVDDVVGHGTGMAGLCLFGDLSELLDGDAHVAIQHKLQSVKILGPTPNDTTLYGRVTADSISKADISAPLSTKIFCLAVTSTERIDGRPSSWSAETRSVFRKSGCS